MSAARKPNLATIIENNLDELPIVQAMVRELRDMGFVVLPLGAVADVERWRNDAIMQAMKAREGGERMNRWFSEGEEKAYQRMLYHLEGGGRTW